MVAVRSPGVSALVERVEAERDRIAALPAPASRPRRTLARRLTGGLLISRLVACVAVMLAATLLDLAAGARRTPSWVLLAAPVLPLVGVAASWTRALDPAHELVAGTPAAGLHAAAVADARGARRRRARRAGRRRRDRRTAARRGCCRAWR